MRAMVLEAAKHLSERAVAKPEPGSGEALIHISTAGICGTDAKIYSGAVAVDYPLIMGHELMGEIVGGQAPGGAGPGTRVLIDPVLYCGHCHHCRQGRTHLCPAGGIMGREQDGGFAEFIAVPEQNIHILPDGVGDQEAPLIQVLSTAVHARDIAKIQPGESVAVLGLGVTGQLHVQLAKSAGAGVVIGVSRNPHKRALAEGFGADITAAHGDDAKDKILDATDGLGADVIIESVGAVTVFAEAMDLVRRAGRIVPFGIYAEEEARLPFYQFYYKELNIFGARAAKGADFPTSINLVDTGAVDLGPLLTHTLPFTELERAIAMLHESDRTRMKVTLSF